MPYVALRSIAVTVFALAVAVRVEAADTQTKSFDVSQIKSLWLETASGDVSITAGAKADVRAAKKDFEKSCKLVIEQQGERLVVTNKSDDDDDDCEVDFEITLPKSVALDLVIGAGDVTVKGMQSSLTYKLGAGDLDVVDAKFSDLKGESGAGEVTVSGTVANGKLQLGVGSANVTLVEAPAKGALDVSVGTGSATVRLPKTAKIKSELTSGLGSVNKEIEDHANASFTISGKTGIGSVTVKGL